MPRWMKRTFFASLFAVVACSGGSGGCSSCSGVTPLPQGFPIDKRIENAASVRLTDSGIKFLNDNLTSMIDQFGGGVLEDGKFVQEIPTSETTITGSIKAKICASGPDANSNPKHCTVEADLKNAELALSPSQPHGLTLQGILPVRLQYLDLAIPLGSPPLAVNIPAQVSLGKNKNSQCAAQDFSPVPIKVEISIEADANPAHGTRTGLSRVKISTFDINIPESDINICGKCDVPIVCSVWDAIIGGIGGLVKGTLIDQLKKPLQEQIDSALCISGTPNTSPPCPLGSHPKDANDASSTCVFDDNENECASFALGTEGTINLGSALSSFSPTTNGGLDFLFSLGGLGSNPNNGGHPFGDLAPINGGATLSLTGGGEANPLATCVTPVVLERPEGIPTPDELISNTVDGWPSDVPGPHFGLALSERFANYALGGIYNSGTLCIQITTEQVDMLTSALIGNVVIPSLNTLPTQKKTAPLGLVLRPAKPPTVKFGGGTSIDTDPTMMVSLPELSIDFYVFSNDRFIRAFTFTTDLTVPVNLDVTAEGLAPQLKDLKLSNTKVTNSFLLKEKPESIASGLEAVLSGALGQALGGGISPIDLSSALASAGLTLNIPPGVDGQGSAGLRKLTKGSDNFLGIFAGLGIASSAPTELWSNTQGVIAQSKIQPEGLRLETMTRDNAPVLQVRAGSSLEAGNRIEYSYRVDKGFWRPWTTDSEFEVRDDILRAQGHHTVYVKSRVVGQPSTVDVNTLAIPVTVDVEAPAIEIGRESGKLVLRASDNVSDDELLQVRFTPVGKSAGEWLPYVANMPLAFDGADAVTVEVKDEEGNIGSVAQPLRGRIDSTNAPAASGCGCTVPGTSQSGPTLPMSLLAIGGVLSLARLGRRRRRSKEMLASAAVLAVAGSWSGCSCSDNDTAIDETPPEETAGSAGSGSTNPCLENDECVTLEPGLIGSYTSAAVAGDGTIWVAGYNEADYGGDAPTYGDLVVGKYDAQTNKVAWKTVDGLDPEEEVEASDYNTEGWRGGFYEAGDNVGLWTSTQIGGGDNPLVAYFDVTHGSLKFTSFDGTKWTAHQVQQKPKAQIGRYAKMLLISGKPVIAFNFVEPGSGGYVFSGVRVARAKTALPTSSSDWTFEDVYVNKVTPCRASFCESGSKCNAVSFACEKPVTGCESCGSGKECLPSESGPKCQEIITSKVESYPEATGLYIAAAVSPATKDLGLVFYDRLRGNLWSAIKAGAWQAQIVDGQTADEPGTDTGDVGIGASLAIDGSGDFHVAYVDGLKEAVKYMKISGGKTPDASSVSIVDEGNPLTAGAGAEKRLVGDDSSIVLDSKNITIAYQDATAGKLRVATRAINGGTWAVKEVKSEEGAFAGAFSVQVSSGGKNLIGHFWRTGGDKPAGDVAFVTP